MSRIFDDAAHDRLRERGWVRLRGAFDPALATELLAAVWQELRETHGIHRDDRSTWKPPWTMPKLARELPVNDRIAGERFQAAISELLGRDDWKRPANWGGFLITFPKAQAWDVPRDTWHWDVPADTWHWDGAPTHAGLFVFSFFSLVAPGGGGTSILAGSHRLIKSFYAGLSAEDRALPHKRHRKLFCESHPWLAELTGRTSHVADRRAHFMERDAEVRGVSCRVVELTGEPGDVVLCSPAILHAVSDNCSEVPRFMRAKMIYPDGQPDRSPSPDA